MYACKKHGKAIGLLLSVQTGHDVRAQAKPCTWLPAVLQTSSTSTPREAQKGTEGQKVTCFPRAQHTQCKTAATPQAFTFFTGCPGPDLYGSGRLIADEVDDALLGN